MKIPSMIKISDVGGMLGLCINNTLLKPSSMELLLTVVASAVSSRGLDDKTASDWQQVPLANEAHT